jgi:hypothetical protein
LRDVGANTFNDITARDPANARKATIRQSGFGPRVGASPARRAILDNA